MPIITSNGKRNEQDEDEEEMKIYSNSKQFKSWKTSTVVPLWDLKRVNVEEREDSINQSFANRSFNYFVIES